MNRYPSVGHASGGPNGGSQGGPAIEITPKKPKTPKTYGDRPYGGPQGGPSGAVPPAVGPYGAPAAGPYGAPAAGPYGAVPPAAGPYGAVPPAAGPYGAPAAGPYGAPAAGPYGAVPPAPGPYGAVPPAPGPYGAVPPHGAVVPYAPPHGAMYPNGAVPPHGAVAIPVAMPATKPGKRDKRWIRSSILVFATSQMISGFVLIGFGAIVEQPPTSGPSVACIILGTFMVVVYILVCVTRGCSSKRECKIVYLVYGVPMTIFLFAFALILLINPDTIIYSLDYYNSVSASAPIVTFTKFWCLFSALFQMLVLLKMFVDGCRRTLVEAQARNAAR